MRSQSARNFAIAAVLSVLAEAASVVLFTRRLSMTEAAGLGTSQGFAGTEEPQPLQGLQVLIQLVSEPSFGFQVLMPQLLLYFVFLWLATTLASWPVTRGDKRGAVWRTGA